MYIWFAYSNIQKNLQKILNKRNLKLVGEGINNRYVSFARILNEL